jgi:hypothetical protein
MDNTSRRQGLLAELAAARTDLEKTLKDFIRRRMAARSALWIVQSAGFDSDTDYEVGDGGTPIRPAQLSALIKHLEADEAQTRELLERVYERLAEIVSETDGQMH